MVRNQTVIQLSLSAEFFIMIRFFLAISVLLINFPLAAQNEAEVPVTIDTLKIGIYDSPPFVHFNENGGLEGVSVWLWERLNGEIDQPFKLLKYEGDHPLSDILKDLEKGAIDFTINPLTITSERHKYLDYTVPFYVGDLTLAKQTETSYESVVEFLHIFFNKNILYLTLIMVASVFAFGLVIWLVEKKNLHFERGWRGLLSSFWWSAVTMTTVGYGDKVPISSLGRLIAFIWMLFSLVIIGLYTATITSNLTVKKLTNDNLQIENFRQLEVGTVEASATSTYLNRNFFNKLTTYPDLKIGLEALNKGEIDYFAYDEPWLAHQLYTNPKYADLEIMPIRFNLQLYSMGMRKGLKPELKENLSERLLFLMEGREWQMLLENYNLKEY